MSLSHPLILSQKATNKDDDVCKIVKKCSWAVSQDNEGGLNLHASGRVYNSFMYVSKSSGPSCQFDQLI